MCRLLPVVLIVLQTSGAWAQNAEIMQILPIGVSGISVDAFGAVIGTKGSEIALYAPDGTKKFRWAAIQCSDGLQPDATDPFRLLVSCPQSGMVYILDNRLAPLGPPLDLFAAGFTDPCRVCTSLKGGIWVFDYRAGSLSFLANGRPRPDRQINVRQWAEIGHYPVLMAETSDFLVLAFPDAGVLVFDLMGNFVRRAPITLPKECAVDGPYFFYIQNRQLNRMDLNDFTTFTYNLPFPQTIIDMKIRKNLVYLVQENTIQVIRIN